MDDESRTRLAELLACQLDYFDDLGRPLLVGEAKSLYFLAMAVTTGVDQSKAAEDYPPPLPLNARI